MRPQEMRTAPQTPTERKMTDFMRDELGAPKVVDRSTLQAELNKLRVREKAQTHDGTRLWQPADGFPWSRWMAPHRSLANSLGCFRVTPVTWRDVGPR
jgi:hypothetical protein